MSVFGLHGMLGAQKFFGYFGEIRTKFLRNSKNLPAPMPMPANEFIDGTPRLAAGV